VVPSLRLNKIFENVSYNSKVIVFMKEIVMDNFQSRLSHIFNFS
jgi:hypothetical protein